ncbi:transcriptional regulator [Couchioplanes caeruleus subsp. azureus]|nr:transcriptional regulator [Couchioplanes caeruleus subsp. azureus]
MLLVHGAAGLGKTHLLDRLAAQATASGHAVLRASAKQDERSLPLDIARQWFHHADHISRRPRRISTMLDSAAAVSAEALASGNSASPVVLRQFQQLYLSLLESAQKRPLLIQVDDAHHADPASLLFLRHVVRRMAATPLKLVLTEHPDAPSSLPELRGELLHLPHVWRQVMTPLSEHEIAGVVRQQARVEITPGLAADYHRLSGGNPALLMALLEDQDRHGAPHRDGYGRTLIDCLRRGDPLSLHAVRAAAVWQDDASSADIAWLIETTPEALEQSLENTSAAGLLAAGRPRHRAAMAAALDDMTAKQRAALHQRAALLRYLRGRADDLLVHHLVRARQPHPQWAADVLVRAAAQATDAGDVRLATERLRAAVDASNHEGTRAELRSRLAQLQSVVSPAAAAMHLDVLVCAADLDQLDAHHRMALVRQLLWHGRVADARRVLTSLRANDATPSLAPFEHWLRSSYPSLAVDAVPPRADAPEADPWLQRVGAMSHRLATGDSDGACEDADMILEGVDPSRGGMWAQEAALLAFAVLNDADRTTTVIAHCDRLLRDGIMPQAAAWEAIVAGARAEAALRQGALALAIEHAQAALTHLTRKSWGVVVGQPLGVLVMASTRAGEFEEGAQWLALPLPEALTDSRWGVGYLHSRGHYHLATGQLQAALDDFLSCGRLCHRWRLDDSLAPAWRVGAAEVFVQLGATDEAQRCLIEQLRRSPSARTEATALRLQAQLTPGARSRPALSRALELFEVCGDRYEQARTLAEVSRVHQLVNETGRARMAFRRAWHLATSCEAQPLRQDLLAARKSQSAPPAMHDSGLPGAADLTASERRVACLAVLGYTNREIGERLFITPSTVEQHLTRVYRKLDVSNRRDLPAWLTAEMAATA